MGNGHMDMDTALTADAMGRVAAAGQAMTTDWRAISAEIADLAGQLGRGDLGAAFLAGYQGPAAQVASATDRCCQLPGVLADKGHNCVRAYVDADAMSSDAFRSVPAPVNRLP